jgi:hypothetical protein
VYGKVDLFVSDVKEDPIDFAGYTGQFLRPKRTLKSLKESDLVDVIQRNNLKL